MRLLTWNVQSLRGSRAGVVSLLREVAPDVACLQEVPRLGLAATRCRNLAQACGMVAVGAGRLAGDTAIFVRPDLPVRRVGRLSLPRTPGLHRRGVSAATLVVNGLPVTVASVHLGLDGVERERHAAALAAWLVPFEGPHVVAGDLNEGPGSPAWTVLAGALGRPANDRWPTFPSSRPAHVIDTAFTGAGLTVTVAEVLPSAASDHLPLVLSVDVRSQLGQ